MSNLIDRLRKGAEGYGFQHSILAEAADALERAEREREDYKKAARIVQESCEIGMAEARRERDELRRVLTFSKFREANVQRCLKWHPAGIESWSPSDWLTAVTGEVGELASLIKMRNRERDGLPGNKFSPSQKQIADEIADVLTYLDLLAAVLGVDLGSAAVEKFNEVSERVGFPDRIDAALRGGDDSQERGLL